MNNTKLIYKLSVIYLSLPAFIFFVGYLKWYVALAAVLICLASCWQVFHSFAECECRKTTGLWPLLFVAFLITFLLGVGGYFTQSSDWMAKNPILNDLVSEPWPVIVYPAQMTNSIQEVCGTQPVALVYYLFYYLPAACIGKFAGLEAARFGLFLWTALGLWLLLNVLEASLKKNTLSVKSTILIILLFVFFGGGFYRTHTSSCRT